MQFVSGVLVCVLAVFTMAQKPHYDVYKSEELFEKFVKDYNRHYKNEIDKEAHYNAFVVSLVRINQYNQKESSPSSATYDINQFADYTPEEEKQSLGFLTLPKHRRT